MPITLTQDQPYQLPGVVPVKFAPTTGNYVKVWLTDAPIGSKLRGTFDLDTQNNIIEVFKGETTATWEADLDVGGAYVFLVQEYIKGASDFGGGYDLDPNAHTTETKVGSEITQRIYIGERMVQKLGTGDRGFADLVLYVWNSTIRQTTIALHGETTPAVQNPTTRRAEAAAYSSTVISSVDDLIDTSVSALLTNLEAMVADMIATIPDHFNNVGGVWHASADTNNDTEIEHLPLKPTTPDGYARAARILAQRLSLHMQNDADGSNRYHTYPDFASAVIAPIPPPGASSITSAWASVADVYRAYEAHRQLADVHALADTVNFLTTTLDPLLTVHKDFLEAYLPLAPTAPAAANPGATHLAQLGFEPDPLPSQIVER